MTFDTASAPSRVRSPLARTVFFRTPGRAANDDTHHSPDGLDLRVALKLFFTAWAGRGRGSAQDGRRRTLSRRWSGICESAGAVPVIRCRNGTAAGAISQGDVIARGNDPPTYIIQTQCSLQIATLLRLRTSCKDSAHCRLQSPDGRPNPAGENTTGALSMRDFPAQFGHRPSFTVPPRFAKVV